MEWRAAKGLSALKKSGKLDEAVAGFADALRLRPNFPEAYGNLGDVLSLQGKLE